MTILLISTCLMALIRYGMSHRRKKRKDREIEDEQRIISSGCPLKQHNITLNLVYQSSLYNNRSYPPSTAGADILDLPPVHSSLDDRPNYFI